MPTVRLLLLGSPFDPVIRAVIERLSGRGGVTLLGVRSLEAIAAARWTHRLGAGGVTTEIVFADGMSFAELAPTKVFNRLHYAPALLYTRMTPADRDYARAEFYALLLSWLASLGPLLVNQATPAALSGPAWRPWQRLALARRAGLCPYPAAATTNARCAPPPSDAAPWPALLPEGEDPLFDAGGFARPRAHGPPPTAVRELLVLGDRIVGDAPSPTIAAGCLRLAALAGAAILLVQLAQAGDDARWRIVTMDAAPAELDVAALDALADWLAVHP